MFAFSFQPLVTILANRWENLEETYIDTSKNVFREIRQERELIYRYFYGTRYNYEISFYTDVVWSLKDENAQTSVYTYGVGCTKGE